MDKIDLIQVFLSSTGEMKDEREAVFRVVDQINRLRGRNDGFRVEVLGWEHDVTPDMGGRPQGIINNQIGDRYQIFVGVLCSKFGTPTGEYGSGTEEEFALALSRRKKHGSLPRIMFYFRDPRTAREVPSARELLRVENFKETLKPLGLYHEYRELPEFEAALLEHLSRSVDFIRSAEAASAEDRNQILETESVDPATGDDDELGLLEIQDRLEIAYATLNSSARQLNDKQRYLTERTQVASEEINDLARLAKLGNRDRRPAKRTVDRLAAAMEDYSSTIERLAVDMTNAFSEVSELLQRATIISSEDGFDQRKEAGQLANQMELLKFVLVQSKSTMNGLAAKIEKVPRMSTMLARARKRTKKAMDRLDEFFSSAISEIDLLTPQLRHYASKQA